MLTTSNYLSHTKFYIHFAIFCFMSLVIYYWDLIDFWYFLYFTVWFCCSNSWSFPLWVVLGIKHSGQGFSIRKFSNTAKIYWEIFQRRDVKNIKRQETWKTQQHNSIRVPLATIIPRLLNPKIMKSVQSAKGFKRLLVKPISELKEGTNKQMNSIIYLDKKVRDTEGKTQQNGWEGNID